MNHDDSANSFEPPLPGVSGSSGAASSTAPSSSQADTKTRILDAAERLFSQYAFEATSLRQITAEAGVNLAAVNYHFQSKDALIEAVIGRRMGPINARRIEMLDAAEAAGNLTAEAIVRAFVVPVFESHEVRHIRPLLGHVFGFPHEFLKRVFEKHLQHIVLRFRIALQQALPAMTPEEINWRFFFMVGSMVHVMAWADIMPEVTGGLCDPAETNLLIDNYVRFISAGWNAPGGMR